MRTIPLVGLVAGGWCWSVCWIQIHSGRCGKKGKKWEMLRGM
jgi:hypothetical protein